MAKIDEPMVRRLSFIRYIYTLGVSQSSQPEPLSSASLLTFHDSVELFLQLASEHLDIGKNSASFMDYWDLLGPRVDGGLTQKESMRRLNKARVALKHHGILPSKLDIDAFRATVVNFFLDNTPKVFQVDFDSISMINLVGCDEARGSLRNAQAHLSQSELEESLELIALAFEQLIDDYENRKRLRFGKSPFFFGEDLMFASSRHMDIERRGDLARFVDVVQESIEAMQSAIKILSLGLDYRRYARFNLLKPYVIRYLSGEHSFQRPQRAAPLTNEDVRYCLDFVIESALHLQQVDYTLSKNGWK